MTAEPSDETVVETAAEAAEGVILSRYSTTELRDIDVTVRFEANVLEVDVYLNPPEDHDADPEAVIEEAIEAAESAIDELLEQ